MRFFLAPQALAGTVGKWESWFWISTFPSSRRWAFAFDWFVLKNVQMAVAVGMWKSPVLRFPSVGGNGGKPSFGFPWFPPTRHFHGHCFYRDGFCFFRSR